MRSCRGNLLAGQRWEPPDRLCRGGCPARIPAKPGPRAAAQGLSRQEKGSRAHSRLARCGQRGRNTPCGDRTPATPRELSRGSGAAGSGVAFAEHPCLPLDSLARELKRQWPPKSRAPEDVPVPLPVSLSRAEPPFPPGEGSRLESCPAPAGLPSRCLHEQPLPGAKPRPQGLLVCCRRTNWGAGSSCWDFPGDPKGELEQRSSKEPPAPVGSALAASLHGHREVLLAQNP